MYGKPDIYGLHFVYPVADTVPYITSDYKYRRSVKDPSKTVFHDALDLRAKSGSGLLAPADGVVTFSGNSGGACGGQINIEHEFVNGKSQIRTYYCHLLKRYVNKGDQVSRGQLIGQTGGAAGDLGRGNSKASHLHFVVQKRDPSSGKWKHTDPKQFMEYALKGLSVPQGDSWWWPFAEEKTPEVPAEEGGWLESILGKPTALHHSYGALSWFDDDMDIELELLLMEDTDDDDD